MDTDEWIGLACGLALISAYLCALVSAYRNRDRPGSDDESKPSSGWGTGGG